MLLLAFVVVVVFHAMWKLYDKYVPLSQRTKIYVEVAMVSIFCALLWVTTQGMMKIS